MDTPSQPEVSMVDAAFEGAIERTLAYELSVDERRLATMLRDLYRATKHTPGAIAFVNQWALTVLEQEAA